MYVDRSRNVYTDASYADRERFSLSRRRVCAYVREKKKRKNAVSNMANGSLFSQTDNDSVWVFRISSLTKFHVVQQWSGKLKKY